MLTSYLEAGLRLQDTEMIIHALTKYTERGMEPHHRVLKLLSNLRQIPDELFVILRRDFQRYGPLIQKVRKFEQPSFRPEAVG